MVTYFCGIYVSKTTVSRNFKNFSGHKDENYKTLSQFAAIINTFLRWFDYKQKL